MNVAILGLGTVGKGVYDILQDHPDVHVSYILERNSELLSELPDIVADSFDTILSDPTVDVIIELIGGTTVAYDMIRQALMHQKHVVTANKAVLSAHLSELTTLAQEHGVHLLFEASVGGAIIVLDPLKGIARVNQIHHIKGIVNGATNYVLTRIYQDDLSLEEAIDEAFEQGYLETGTTDDMDGLDALRKIHLLSSIAYQSYLDPNDVIRTPLSSLTETFHYHVKTSGYIIKYLAQSTCIENTVTMSVMPVILSKQHQYDNIQYEWNAIDVYGKYHERQRFEGQGAGRYPTASAVVYDLMSIRDNTVHQAAFSNVLQSNPNLEQHRYLIQREDGFHLTEPITITELYQSPSVICHARWEVEE